MQPNKRREWILQLLKDNGKVEIDELARELDVSTMTIRRDLDQLEEDGQVIRIHGGAVLPKPLITETPFITKESKRMDQKRAIANKAISYIKDGQTILLDSGTTTLELARLLKQRENLTIITNDIKIAAELLDSQLRVIVTGGELQNDVGALFGPQTHQLLKDIHVDLFFLGAHAIDLKAGVTSPTFEKSLVKQLMIQSAENTWLLADSSKIQQKAFSKVCDLKEINGFITDNEISIDTKKELSEFIEVL
ncbi:DeoR/GlpR family DNA-binding transcription regulator [Ornithinibacillus halophilus]|uniref:Transcriptional regulator, DeoR family n=1 Tax=Ornithinibacillus halophilus TaxID=930117 RepID=A0A1M5IET0_9BACI|nr:DeoR/GlpR family DNA-binding transcription regulator [Ornithinibacillus halophilus]SHG26420.1 transcriptional regulator, DeoR family [Ornithinibacillus halophilus]